LSCRAYLLPPLQTTVELIRLQFGGAAIKSPAASSGTIGDMHAESVIAMSEAGVRDPTKEAFRELVLAELPALYSLARRLVRDGAEDLVQEALLQAFRGFATLKEDAAAGRWLKTILVNVFRDQLRKRSRT